MLSVSRCAATNQHISPALPLEVRRIWYKASVYIYAAVTVSLLVHNIMECQWSQKDLLSLHTLVSSLISHCSLCCSPRLCQYLSRVHCIKLYMFLSLFGLQWISICHIKLFEKSHNYHHLPKHRNEKKPQPYLKWLKTVGFGLQCQHRSFA